MCFGNDAKTGSSNQFQMGSQSQTSSNTYDPWVTSGAQGIFSGAQGWAASNPWQGYNGPTQAGFGPETDAASGYLQSILGQNNPLLEAAGKGYGDIAGSIDPNASIQSYMSPYTDAVLQPTLRKILETSGRQGQAAKSAATMAGAYGGTGAGVQQALLDRNTQQSIGDATGSAYDKAFTNAQATRQSNLQTLLAARAGQAGVGQQETGNQSAIAQMLAAIGGQKQQAGQTGINTAIGVNASNQQGQLNQYQTLMQILAGLPKNSTSTSFGNSMGYGASAQYKPDNSGFNFLGSLFGSLLG